jgi:hypothetical protein
MILGTPIIELPLLLNLEVFDLISLFILGDLFEFVLLDSLSCDYRPVLSFHVLDLFLLEQKLCVKDMRRFGLGWFLS